jgi:fucose 4-O-acetylase-like acetyltransferase
MKQRIAYWDIARGLAVLLVIFYHVPLYIAIAHPDAAGLVAGHIHAGTAFRPFFMPVFFIISGYFTHTEKAYYHFLWSDIKHLLLAGLALTFLSYLIQAVALNSYQVLGDFFKGLFSPRFLDLLFLNWFISALFFARQIYYWIDRLALFASHNRRWLYWGIEGVCLILIAMAGILVEPHAPHNAEWYYIQGLVFAVFLAFGKLLRTFPVPPLWLLGAGMVYVLLMIMAQQFGISTWEYGMINTTFTLSHWPFYMLLALTGSALLLGIAAYITFPPLEFLGRHSLIFYVPQGGILYGIAVLLGRWFLPDTPARIWLYLLIMWVLVLIILSALGAAKDFCYNIGCAFLHKKCKLSNNKSSWQ